MNMKKLEAFAKQAAQPFVVYCLIPAYDEAFSVKVLLGGLY